MNCSPASQDFKGQLHCERAFQITVVAFGIVGFIVGYLQQEFRLTFYFLATGGGISAVVRTRIASSLSRAQRSRMREPIAPFVLT